MLKRLLMSIWVVVPCFLVGQGNYATVTGIVVDSAKAVVPGVQITIRNVDTDIARNLRTTETGDFTLTNLLPGA